MFGHNFMYLFCEISLRVAVFAQTANDACSLVLRKSISFETFYALFVAPKLKGIYFLCSA